MGERSGLERAGESDMKENEEPSGAEGRRTGRGVKETQQRVVLGKLQRREF